MQEKFPLTRLSQQNDSADVLDLTMRAADYVILETGRGPDKEYVHKFFTETPASHSQEDLLHYGVMRDTLLVGIVGIATRYEYPDEWWIGLMLLDPAFRNQQIGHRVMVELKHRARSKKINMMKLAVLCANSGGLAFWTREGFAQHRRARATPDGDGHDRLVLEYKL